MGGTRLSPCLFFWNYSKTTQRIYFKLLKFVEHLFLISTQFRKILWYYISNSTRLKFLLCKKYLESEVSKTFRSFFRIWSTKFFCDIWKTLSYFGIRHYFVFFLQYDVVGCDHFLLTVLYCHSTSCSPTSFKVDLLRSRQQKITLDCIWEVNTQKPFQKIFANIFFLTSFMKSNVFKKKRKECVLWCRHDQSDGVITQTSMNFKNSSKTCLGFWTQKQLFSTNSRKSLNWWHHFPYDDVINKVFANLKHTRLRLLVCKLLPSKLNPI